MNTGWIKLHRSLHDNPRARDPDWVAVWVYLLLHATHKPHKTLFGGNVVELQPGQLVTGRKKISLETGVNEPKTKRVLSCLESDHQIGRQRCSTSSLITITKWDQYQASDQPNGQQMDSEWTASGQPVDTIQEGKEKKNGKKEEVLMSDKAYFGDVISAYHEECKSLPRTRLTETAKKTIDARWAEYPSVSTFRKVFKAIERSDWHSGRSGKWLSCNFAWILKKANFDKFLDTANRMTAPSHTQYEETDRY